MSNDWKSFFAHFGSESMTSAAHYCTPERFYQMVKQRLMAELRVADPNSSFWGKLTEVDKEQL